MINQHFGSDSGGLGSGKLGIEEAVEIMSGSSMDEKSERTKTDGAHWIVGFAIVVDKILREDVTNGETSEGGERLGEEGLSLE